MLGLKHILSILLLVIASMAVAQESYVIDSVCVGSDRIYRLDGQQGSDYRWDIFRSADASIFGDSVSYTTFMDVDRPAAGDTTWGSEIVLLWDEIGEFDIEVTHWSEHRCDTIEIGKIIVFPTPEAEAGPGDVICELADITVSGDTVWNNSTLFWTSTGDGTFSDNTQLHPTYYLGSNDILGNSVTLILTAYGAAENGTCIPAVDSATFQFSSPDIDFTMVQDPLCFNDKNGAITATITDGLPEYTYSWTGSDGFVSSGSNNINDLAAGTYVLTITDANGCSDTDSVEIVNPEKLVPSIDFVQNVSCYGYNDGAILASAVGGTGEIRFEWTGTSGFTASGNSINNLSGGSYLLTISDDNGCTDTVSVLVEEPNLLLATISAADSVLCEGEELLLFGEITGGTGTMEHRWTGDGAAYLNSANINSPLFAGAPSGNFTLVYSIRDEANCEANDTFEIYVAPPSYSFDTLEVCAGADPLPWNSLTIFADADRTYHDTLRNANQYGCDSLLTLDVKVLFPVYDYDTMFVCENEEPFIKYSQTIIPGIDSTYTDTARYIQSGCDSLYILLQVFTLPVTDTLLDSTLCAGAEEFMWNNRLIQTEFDSIYLDTLINHYGCDSLLTYDVKILPPDTFYVEMTFCQDMLVDVWNGVTIQTKTDSIYEARLANSFGCDSLVILTTTILPTTYADLDSTLCAGTPDFYWNNRLIVSERDSIYLDTIPNANQFGCDSLLTYDVHILLPDTIYVYDTLCYNDPVYVWNEITVLTDSDSIYQATLENSLMCDSVVILNVAIIKGVIIDNYAEACETYTWIDGTKLTYTSSGTYDHVVGGTSCNDTLRLHLTINHGLYTEIPETACDSFTWIAGDGNTYYTSQLVDHFTPGANGCNDTLRLNLTIDVGPPVIVSIQTDTTVVVEGELVTFTATPENGGTLPLYTWYVNHVEVPGEVSEVFSYIPNDGDSVCVMLTSDLYCAGSALSDHITLSFGGSQGSLTVDAVPTPVLCFNGSDGAIEIEVSEGSGNYGYAWAGPNGFTSTDEDILGLAAGNYTVIVTDLDDSTFTGKATANVSQPSELSLSFTKVDVGNSTDPVGSINLTVTGGTPGYTVLWTGPDGFTSTDQNIDQLEKGNYTVVVTDKNGCERSGAVQISGYGMPCLDPVVICPDTDLPRAYTTREAYEANIGQIESTFDLIDATFKVEDVSNNESCPETIVRTYSIQNTNGDVISCEQLITRNDIQNPTYLDIPSLTMYNCFESTEKYSDLDDLEARNPEAAWRDNCEITGLKMVRETELSASCPYIIQRVYQVFDACGNLSREAVHTITVRDTTPPEIVSLRIDTLPDLAAVCEVPEPITDVADFKDLYMWDACNEPITVSFVNDMPAGTDEPNVIYRTYRFADACDNGVLKIQRITVAGMLTPLFEAIGPLCLNSTAPLLPTTSTNNITGKWSPSSTIQTDIAGITTYVFTPDDGQCAAPVTMEIVVTPEILLSATQVDIGFSPDAIGEIDLTVTNGIAPFTYNWSNGATTEDLTNLIAGDYTVHVTDAIACVADTTITITSEAPEMSCAPDTIVECPDLTFYPPYKNYSQYVSAGGSATSSINIDYASFAFVGDDTIASTYCHSIERTYSIKDILGNETRCTQVIHVDDQVSPSITCPEDESAECLSDAISNIETFADFVAAGGQASDNCEIDPESFSVKRNTNITTGSTEIITTYSISDLCGNTDSCKHTFVLTDDIPPVVVCNDITVILDSTGNYVLTEIDMQTIAAGSSDNCTSAENLIVEVDVTEFTCEFVESGKVVDVTVTDEAGNVSEVCRAQITVVDNVPPVALCQDITVYLDENGQAQITKEMIDSGSFDNCELNRVELSNDQFDCTDVGDNSVVLTVFDNYGNSTSCEATVTVIDQIPPSISCVEKTIIQLDENASFTFTWDMVSESVFDECGIDTVLLSRYELGCEDIGTTFITAIAYDVNGNADSCVAEFVVLGNIPPNALNDTAVTAVNVPVEINVLANDYDLKSDIDPSSLGILIPPSHGAVKIDTKTGLVSYTPDQDYIGSDIFRYSICDDAIPCESMCDEALVFITVREGNEPPLAVNDSFDVPCGSLFGNLFEDNSLGIDSDPDKDEIILVPIAATNPANGNVILYPNGNFEYEPYVDFVGVDSFQYIIKDNSLVPVTPLYDTAWVYITRVADNDCDGIADIDDIDDDNDGIRDIYEGDGEFDSDRDGIPDSHDIDSDNDGIPDNIEGQGEDNYINPDGWRDANGNGWDDRYDPEEGGYPFDLDLADTDGDLMPDFLDIDSDNDGVFDYIEGHDENADGIADVIRMYVDTDYDGLDDAYDTNPGWGLTDNETGSSAPIQDFDSDGTRDWRDTNDEDDEHLTVVEDLNGNGDYSDDDLDLDGHPEYLDTEMDCELFIPEGFSPNDDGVHDFFQILCIYPRYPEAKLMIFNRQGQKIFEKENYGNYDVWGWDDAWWWGTSENRFTIGKSGGLPAGNYVYVIELGNGEVENGTVMIAY